MKQCEARIVAAARAARPETADVSALARRVAWIVAGNRERGRVPQDQPPDPQTGVPDSYIDEVLFFLQREGPTVGALRASDREAWVRVLALMATRAYGYLLHYGVEAGQARQLAEDFAQTSGLTLWGQALERFSYDTHLDAWISQIVAYEVSQWYRSGKEQRQQRALSLDAVTDSQVQDTLYRILPDPAAGRTLDAAEARLMLEDALAQLASQEQRQVIVWGLAGHSNAEIAEALNRSVQAVYNLRHRAMAALREILGGKRSSK